MRKAFPQVIVHKAPHALSEAVQLALSYYTILAEGMETPAAWEEAHLIHRGERFTLPPEQIDAAFADVRAYLRRCRANARPLLEGDPQLGALFQIRLSGMAEDAQLEPFLPSALMLTDVESSEQLTKPLFIRGCLMHLYAMAGMMDLSLQGEEAQAQYHHVSDPARFTMAQVMRAVDLVQITDAQRMTLLRFFQDLDAWTLRMTALLAKLETVCRTHYPLVADRFLSKAASLDSQSSDEQAYQWFARMGQDKDAAPSDAPLHVWPAVIAYNGLDIQLSPWHAVRQRMHVGVLFDDLSRLQEVSRLVARYSGLAPERTRPVVGENAFAHESGIHIAAILEDPATYEYVPPEMVGGERRFILGKHTGRKALEHVAKAYGFELSDREAQWVLEQIKRKSEGKCSVTPEVLCTILRQAKGGVPS